MKKTLAFFMTILIAAYPFPVQGAITVHPVDVWTYNGIEYYTQNFEGTLLSYGTTQSEKTILFTFRNQKTEIQTLLSVFTDGKSPVRHSYTFDFKAGRAKLGKAEPQPEDANRVKQISATGSYLSFRNVLYTDFRFAVMRSFLLQHHLESEWLTPIFPIPTRESSW